MSGEDSLHASEQEHQQLLKALRESELLREFSELLASSLDPTHILQVLVRRTTDACEVKRCAVWLLDSRRGIFVPSAYHFSAAHLQGKELHIADKVWRRSSLPFDDPLIHRLFAQDGMLALENLATNASPPIQAIAEKFHVRSILLVALVREGRPVGMMSLDNRDQSSLFSQEQQQLARAIGQQAAIAIDNAQLYQEAQNERKRAERLIERAQSIYQVATSLNSGNPLTTILDLATHHLVSGTDANGAAIALLNRDTDNLSVVSTSGLHTLSEADIQSIALHELPSCHTAAMTGKSSFVKREQTEGNEYRWYQHLGLEHVLIVPLKVGVQSRNRRKEGKKKEEGHHTYCTGFAFINYPSATHHLAEGYTAFAQDIAMQCALAIEKDQMLDKVHRAAILATERANTLDAMLNAMNEGIIVLDMEGRVIVNNSTATHFLGLPGQSKEPLMQLLQHQRMYRLDGRPFAFEHFPLARALRGATIHGERFMTRRTDASERIVEVNIVPLLDSEAQQIGIVSAFRDITEQVRIERRVRGALDALLHAAEVISGVTEIKEILHRVLAMTLKALGCERGVVQSYDQKLQLFTPLLSLGFLGDSETQWLQAQKHWLAPEADAHCGFRTQLLAGHATLVNEEQCPEQAELFHNTMILAAPIMYNHHLFGVIMLDRSSIATTQTTHEQAIHGAFLSSQRTFNVWDIAIVEGIAQFAGLAIEQTHWQQEAEIARTNEATMRESNVLKDEFLAITAHEFRTPLTIILAHSQMMTRFLHRLPDQKQDITNNRMYESLQSIETQAHQLTNIVDTFLEVTRLNRGQIMLNTEKIDLEELATEAVNTNSTTSMLRIINFTVETAAHPYIVNGDRLRLLQIFGNLLQNALKYSPPETPITVSLTQKCTPEGGRLAEVRIQDQGIGIPSDAQPHLFESFYRAPNIVGNHTHGVGLGLYIVAEFLHLHDGTIRVESSGIPGNGSCFIFTLPLL